MKCRNCPEGKRYAKGSVNCILYGIIIREDHDCIREGGKRHEGNEVDSFHSGEGTGIQEDSWDAADLMPGLFPES